MTESPIPQQPFHVMAKPTGSLCNLNCTYCFYLEKESLYPGTKNWAMPDAVLESYIQQYIASQPGSELTFAWQGGEPTLLGLDYFRRIAELQQTHSDGRPIRNAIQTNAVLIDQEWAEFFKQQNFLVGVSIDGPAHLHDHYRVDKGGKPTFAQVMRGIDLLQQASVEFNTLTVVNRENSQHPLEVYNFLKEIGSTFLQFIPVVERSGPSSSGLVLLSPADTAQTTVTDWTVEPEAYGQFLSAIFDQWVRHDVGKIYIQLFEVALEVWIGRPASLCVFSETCGSAVALEHNGDLYSCDHYVYPENRLGNLMDDPLASLVGKQQQKDFGNAKRDSLPKQCLDCDVRFLCNGECPKHRFMTTADGEPGLNYLCAGYQYIFRHVAPYMEFMGRELLQSRPPSRVMDYAAWVDEQLALPTHKSPSS